MNLLLTVLTPFAGALIPPFMAGRGRHFAAWSAGAVAALALLWLLPLLPAVFAGETQVLTLPWLPDYGLDLAFRLDGLAMLFALLILCIGLLIILYAAYYLPRDDGLGRFYFFLLLFMGAMLGIVLAENLLVMLVFWELTSLSSFLLIAYKHHYSDSRQAARMALAVTGGGGLALLGGILLLGHIAGSFNLSVILAAGDLIKAHPLYLPMLVLVLLGVFTKSAQFPFHFWLPGAMAAPTPVSAYLHSATMVKAGVFLLARLFPALSGTEPWFYLVVGAGAVTVVFAAYGALFKHDFKGLLAYSTVSHLGLITLLFGLGTPAAAVAGVFHIINHATFKASLFMAAGIIDHECGTRDMRRINGLIRYMPWTGALATVAAASMAGVPFFNGFLSKEMFFAETLHPTVLGDWNWILPMAATLAGILSVAYSVRFIHDVFFNTGEPMDLGRTPHEPPRWMRIPVEILVAICLLVGVLPAFTVAPLLAVAAAGTLQGPLPEYSLAIWHGFNAPLLMSFVALAGGVFVYSQRRRLFAWHDRFLPEISGKGVFEALYHGLLCVSRGITARVDNGSLQRYAAWLIGFTVLLGAYGYLSGPSVPFTGSRELLSLDGVSAAATLALVIAALVTTFMHRHRLLAIVVLSVVGLVVALAFVRLSAPDLALTQLSVEVVTIVLMLLALFYLPQFAPVESTSARRVRDAGLAVVAGLGASAITWSLITRPFETLSGFYLRESLPGGGGSNVVNVILVDFRGFDTMGEITVLAMAALGIHSLIDGLRLRLPQRDMFGRPWAPGAHPTFLVAITKPLLPLSLMVAIYILLRGHNLPGGGFIAGLVAGVALILQYMASGIDWTAARMRINYHAVFATGLSFSALTGVGAWFFDRPFLTSTYGHMHWPLVGEFELASAMVFDLGVFLTVVGAVLLILAELGKLSGHASAPEPASATLAAATGGTR